MANQNPYNTPLSSFEVNILMPPSLVAGQDLTTNQYRFVKMTAQGTVVPATLGDQTLGVQQDKPINLRGVGVMSIGISNVIAGAAVSAGDKVQSDANGAAITATSGAVAGIALQPASAAGVKIPVLLK